mgnify:CR=1 FL=1|jgi:hypothetical protein
MNLQTTFELNTSFLTPFFMFYCMFAGGVATTGGGLETSRKGRPDVDALQQ